MSSRSTREKKKTCIEKYGYENSILNPEVKKKATASLIKKYGVEHPIQSEIIKEKIRNTNLKRYGCEHPSQNIYIREKISQKLYNNQSITTSKQQKYLHLLFGGEINYPINGYSADIAIVNEKIVIEYNGGGHKLNVIMGNMTDDEFKLKEIIRTNVFKRNGWKTIFLTSDDDKIPSDEVLLSIYDFACLFFKNNPDRSWIDFNFTEGVYKNALCKEGTFYNYGPLRRIYKHQVDYI